jgi:hypothetical protein
MPTHSGAHRKLDLPKRKFFSILGLLRWAFPQLRPRTQAHLGVPLLTIQLVFFSFPITDSEDDGESEAAKQLIQPIAEKIIAKYKAKEEEAPLLFFVAGEVSCGRRVWWP